jgi:hypothetical protein
MKKNNIFASIISAKPLYDAHLGGFSIITILLVSGIWSCNSTKKVATTTQIKDSIVFVNKIDTIREFKTIFKGFDTQLNFKCDSTALNQVYKSGDVQYKIIKEKGEIRFLIKKDTIFLKDTYKSKSKDSLQRVVNKSIENKTIVRKPFFADFWKIAFFILLILWIFGITPMFIFKLIKKSFIPL